MNAVLEVLSVGGGDIKLIFDEGDEDKARETISRMLKEDYTLMVNTDKGVRRVKRFSPKTLEYIIVDSPTNPTTASRGPEKKVPMKDSHAIAVGATAGG